MTVKVEDTCEGSAEDKAGLGDRSLDSIEDISNNNSNNSVSLTESTSATAITSSLDSVVQRLIHKKMGRRKQNCPQRTGNLSEEGKHKPFLIEFKGGTQQKHVIRLSWDWLITVKSNLIPREYKIKGSFTTLFLMNKKKSK